MVPRFGKPVPVLSMVTNHVIDYIYTIHGHRITRWNDALLNPPALDTYVRSVHAKGRGPLSRTVLALLMAL